MKHSGIVAAAALVVALQSACSVHRLAPDADGVSFPLREDSHRPEGIVVSPQTISLLRPGLNKDQVRQILGGPHFREGLIAVEDWNYVLNLPEPAGGLLSCQYQLRFDKAQQVASTHWQSQACANVAAGQARAGETVAAAGTSTGSTWLEEGLVFPFGRSGLKDLQPEDRARLDALATRIVAEKASVKRITVVGHADRIGSTERKYRRSLERARAVAEFLADKGIAPARIDIVGRSDTEPLSACTTTQPAVQLRDCLATDRRVSVTVELEKG